MKKVYIIEWGEYEERGVFGVASSVTAAVNHIKKTFSYPYIVNWEELKVDDSPWATRFRLKGNFSHVEHISTPHDDEFEITEYEFQE